MFLKMIAQTSQIFLCVAVDKKIPQFFVNKTVMVKELAYTTSLYNYSHMKTS